MKLVLISDLHLLLDNPRSRLDNVHEAQKRKLGYVLDWCEKNSAVLLQAGDFFDKSRSWLLLDAWMGFLESHTFDICTVYGQHDLYMRSEETRGATILGVLSTAEFVKVLGDRPLWADNAVVYGCSYGQEVPEVKDRKATNILVIHKMIVPSKMWTGQDDYVYAPEFLNRHKDFDLILCGDCHRKFLFYSADKKGRIICNTGPMTRRTAEEYSFEHKPGFYEYNTETRKIRWHEIPHEPAGKVLTREHIEKEEEINGMLDGFIEAVGESGDIGGLSFRDNLEVLMSKEQVGTRVKEIVTEVTEDESKDH